MTKSVIVGAIAIATWALWLFCLGYPQALSHLLDHWRIALTMLLGSVIAGGTSVGGGAVAFPIFTKLLQITPYDAKVFSLAIQSVGMGAASLTIWFSGIQIERRALFWSSLGGIPGIFLGLGLLAPVLPADAIKLSFAVMLGSFAVTLLALNWGARRCNSTIPIWGTSERGLLFLGGFLGGIMGGLVGNGIDICIFSLLVLLFRVSEKVATPTSVILMAINAIVGFVLQLFVFQDFTEPAVGYWLAAIPIVVVGAPLGAIFCSLLRREAIANILIGLIAIELVSSLLLIPLRPVVAISSLAALMLFSGLNYWMCRIQIYTVQSESF